MILISFKEWNHIKLTWQEEYCFIFFLRGEQFLFLFLGLKKAILSSLLGDFLPGETDKNVSLLVSDSVPELKKD